MNKKKKTNDNVDKKRKAKKKKMKRPVLDKVVIVFLIFSLLIGVGGLSILGYIITTTDASDLMGQMINKEPSVYYADDGSEVGENGAESRQNVSYQQIPETVVDAFLAIEDSRYFKHNGFDLPRFISSAFANLKSGSFAQGGSTLSMQAVDNFFMKRDEEKMDKEGKSYNSIQKIERKLKEIYMSMRLESQSTKEEIIEKYLNQINFGDQARGIERGAQYFFGKSVADLNLSESAYLAGCINAPNTYNPYNGYDNIKNVNYYKYATERRDETLQLMLQHGFITEIEYKLAKSTKLAFQVAGKNTASKDPYKNFVEAANKEAMAITGKDPATTPMKIYTTLNKKAQDQANKAAAGDVVSLSSNTEYQVAFTVLNSKTGAIVAVCPGRSDVEETVYKSRFSDVDRLPGSSIKPIVDYAYALDNLGYCTSRVFNDKEIQVDGRTIVNADRKYYGKVSMERAIAQSLNTPAVQTLKDVVDREGTDKIKEYLLKQGFSKDKGVDTFNLLYSIGGTMTVSPTQMAGAFASLANGGTYTEPHMVTRIEFKDGKTPAIDVKAKTTQPLSAQAAYMTSELLYKAINGKYSGWNLMGRLGFGAYPVYGKTGTSDWAKDGLSWGIPEGAMKDEWMVNYTSEYTIATWSGFDQGGPNNYVNNDLLYANIPGWINKSILDTLSSNPTRIANPGGISSYGGGMIKTEFLKDAAKNNPMTEVDTHSSMDTLQSLYDSLKNYDASGYSADSFAKFKAALEAARKLLESGSASDADIQNAINNLNSAASGLVANVSKNGLINAINNAASLNMNAYTAESYNNLSAVINSAKAVLNRDRVTQGEIDAQIGLINQAIASLVPKQVVNKSGLQSAITDASAKLNSITPDDANYATLQSAINAASNTLNNPNATQAEVDAQTGALRNILSAM